MCRESIETGIVKIGNHIYLYVFNIFHVFISNDDEPAPLFGSETLQRATLVFCYLLQPSVFINYPRKNHKYFVNLKVRDFQFRRFGKTACKPECKKPAESRALRKHLTKDGRSF